MGLIKKYYKLVSVLSVAVCIMAACTVSYKFNGASINYDKVKTISFENFPNRSAAFVWGPMESMFNTALQDIYMQQTRLKQVRQGGDLELTKYTTATYPIFIRECVVTEGSSPEKTVQFYKIYEPLNPDKQWRFSYTPDGGKPKQYINGFRELQKAYRDYNAQEE